VEDLRVNGWIILKRFFKNCTDLDWTDPGQNRVKWDYWEHGSYPPGNITCGKYQYKQRSYQFLSINTVLRGVTSLRVSAILQGRKSVSAWMSCYGHPW
jgi:hypothetical protein